MEEEILPLMGEDWGSWCLSSAVQRDLPASTLSALPPHVFPGPAQMQNDSKAPDPVAHSVSRALHRY